MSKNSYCVIMAGGIGSRFWPESSPEMPKQFLDILGVGKTLIQQTYERFVKIIPNKNILIVTSEKYFDIVKQQIPDILDENILTEPMRRNTAPCILYAALKIKHKNSVANVVVTPADHLILNETEFLKDIEEGICFSEKKNGLITLGITPNRPATTYGYIKRGENLNDCNFYKILNFTEKPNSDLAKQFIQDGNYLWNAGIFVWNNDLIINEIKKNLPEIYQKFENDIDFSNQENEKKSIEKIYDKINGISIDFGVMEKSNNVFVKKTDFGWSDLGTWDSIYQLKEKDQNENVILAQKIILENSNGNFIKSNNNNKILAIRDLEDFIVIDTNDVVLICKRENEQKIQDLLTEAKNKFSNGF